MNDLQAPPIPSQPKTSVLAICSLIFGILGILCFSFLTAIPAVICGHMALSRIKRAGGILTGNGLAIGGLVTGYIGIAMIPLLMAIAIPNFVHARRTAQMNACINNLRQIDTAKQQWALENKKEKTDIAAENDLKPFLLHGEFPKCPAGGTYTIKSVGETPVCSLPDHNLP